MGHFFSGEFIGGWGGGTEAADGCSKWIFLVSKEASSSAAACGVGGGGGVQRRVSGENE